MRLLDVHALEFQNFAHDQVPKYAIASHRWGNDADEVRFKDIERRRNTHSPGYKKVEGFAKYVREHLPDIDYLWIDTCCIRQDSDREVSEAVNSMFRFYQEAEICLAYLADVQSKHDLDAFKKSVWHRRGWTLQELLAPHRVLFLTREWETIGCKTEHEADVFPVLKSTIALATGLPEDVLANYHYSKRYGTEEKFRWTTGRQTTRPEDQVYCLFGVFDVAMPVIYGEGYERARKRLLDEIGPAALEANRKSISMIPYQRNLAFVDRPELLGQVRTAMDMSAARIALVGLGGVGKTQLAVEYAYQLRSKEDAPWVLWLQASSSSRLSQSVQDIAHRLRLPGHEVNDANFLLLFYAWLSDEKNGKWLLVIDSVDDSNIVMRSFSAKKSSTPMRKWLDYIPTCEHGSILITSRNRLAANDIVGETQIVEIPAMDGAQAEMLLTRKLDSTAGDGNLQDLAEALDHNPLAMAQAAAYIKNHAPRSTVQSYLTEFKESQNKRMKLLCWDSNPLARHEHTSSSVLLAWRTSFDLIKETRKSAADLLSLMSMCDGRAIPEMLIRSIRGQSNDFRSPSAGVVLPHESETFEEDIVLLRSFYFISTNTSDTWQMCQLVQDAVRLWLSERQEIQTWTAALAHSLAAAFPPSAESENLPVHITLLPHVKCAMGMRPLDREALLCWAKVMRAHACFSRTKGGITDAEELAEASSDAMMAEFGVQHIDTLQSMNEFALVRRKQDRYAEAQALHEQALGAVKIIPGDDCGEALLLHTKHLAIVYLDLEKYEEAGKLFLEVLDTHGTDDTKESAEVLPAVRSLSSKLIDLDRCEEAKELLEKVWSLDKATFGEEHPDTIAAMQNLAATFFDHEKYSEAEELLQKTLSFKRKVLGDERTDTLGIMTLLGLTYLRLQRYQEAIDNFQKALAAFDEDHEDALKCTLGLASAHSQTGGRLKAMDLFQKALAGFCTHHEDVLGRMRACDTLSKAGKYQEAADLFRKALAGSGDDDEHVQLFMKAFAFQLIKEGKNQEAMDLCQKLLAAVQEVLGPDDHSSLATKHELASVLHHSGNSAEAERLMSYVVERRTKILGLDHEDTLRSMHSLAFHLSKGGKLSAARKLSLDVVERRTKVLGPEHVNTLDSMCNLAKYLGKQGKFYEAVELYEKTVEGRTKVLGAEHVDTLKSMHQLAYYLGRRGKFDKAAELWRKTVDGSTKVQGAEHVNTLLSMHMNAQLPREQGKFEKAVEMMQKTVNGFTKVLGAEHVDTLLSMHNLAYCLGEQGKFREAVELGQKTVEGKTKVLGPDHPDTIRSAENLAIDRKKLQRQEWRHRIFGSSGK